MRIRLSLVKKVCVAALVAVMGASAAKPALASGKPLKVQNGVLTVDGLTVKTGVNLRVANLHYLYVGIPGAGTAVISEQPFAGAREQRAAFHGNALTVMAGERRLQLTAANRMRGTHSAYVRFDRGTGPATRLPVVSYGEAAMEPAIWPEDDGVARGPRVRVRVKARRSMRTAKLCRPSPHGRELCATVREVAYKGW